MKVSLDWLKDYIDIKISPERLADLLSFHSFEVENVNILGKEIEKVVVGEIIDIKPHPKADNLKIAVFNVGKSKPINVIFNQKKARVEVDQNIPVALAGATLCGGIKVKRMKLRGVESEGMMCSEAELGLAEKADNVMILDEKAPIGRDIVNILGLQHAIFGINVNPNRPDCFSHIGIAREISALTQKPLKISLSDEKQQVSEKMPLEVKVDSKICPRYSAYVISGVKIKESQDWIKKRLQSVNIRPINNVVDVTNYIMMDLGQPLHAFDYDKISGHKMIVRKAEKGEEVITLDGIAKKLNEGMPIIQDEKDIIDLAGIMGGKNSEISEDTKTIVLQAANFSPVAIHKTSRELGHRTDASNIYEKGVDVNLTIPALNKAFELLKKISGDDVKDLKISNVIDIQNLKVKPFDIELKFENVEKLLGIKIDSNKIIKILESLEFKCKRKGGGDSIFVTVPTFRSDIHIEEDLIEEVARIYGYEKIPAELPQDISMPKETDDKYFWRSFTRKVLEGAGFTEIYTPSFNSEDTIKKLNLDPKTHLRILNPIAEDQEFLQASLAPSMLEVVSKNLKNFDEVKLFELSKIFSIESKKKMPDEPMMLVGAIGNFQFPISNSKLFYEAKGTLELLLDKLGLDIDRIRFKPYDPGQETFHPARTALIEVYGENIGYIGEIHPKVLARFDIKGRVAIFDIEYDKLMEMATRKKIYKQISKFPPVTLDLAAIFDKKTLAKDVLEIIKKAGGKMLSDIEIFDIYEGKGIPKGKKNLAFHLTYQSYDYTLEDKEVKNVHEKICGALEKEVRAEIRGQERFMGFI